MVKGHETEAYVPQFLLYNRKTFHFEGAENRRWCRVIDEWHIFLLNLMSAVLLIHGQERVQTSLKQLILIWDSIASSKVHNHTSNDI